MTRAAPAVLACLLALGLDGAPRGGAIALRVAPGQPVVAALRTAEAHELRVRAPARSYVALRVTQLGQNVTLSLPARRGHSARFVDGRTTLTGDETLALVTGEDDEELRVEVRLAWSTPAAAARGQYRVELLALRPRHPGDDARIAASVLVERAEAELREGRAASIAAARADAIAAAARWAPGGLGDAVQEARALAVAGRAAALLGTPDDAVRLLEQAASAAEHGGDATGAATATLAIARALVGRGSEDSAARVARLTATATAAIDALGDDRARADSLNLAIEEALERSDPRAAEAALSPLQALAAAIGDPLLAAHAVFWDGDIAYEFGEAERARARLEDSVHLLRALGPAAEHDLSEALHALASATTKFDSAYARSVPIIEEAIALARRTGSRDSEAGSLGQLAGALRHLGEHRRAREVLERELALQRELRATIGEAYALGGIGLVRFDLGDRDGAAESLREALTVLARGSYPTYEARTLFFLARVEQARNNLDAALAAVERAIALTEEIRGALAASTRRASFSASIRRYFELLVDIELQIADARPRDRDAWLSRALAASDRAHARALREELERSGGPHDDHAAPAALDVAALRARLARRGAVAIEYFLGETRSYAFAVSAAGIAARTLAARGDLEQRARAALADLSARASAAITPARIAEADARWDQASRALGGELLGVADDALRPGAPLVLVTDGAMDDLPFAALTVPGGDERVVGRYVLERVPSLALALAQRRGPAQRGGPRALVLADPVFSNDDERAPVDAHRTRAPDGARALARLPGTGAEARAIGALAPGPQITLALGFEATRDRLLSPASAGYDVLHIASHAIVDAARPERTGLVLSQLDARGAPRDGFVSLADVERLALHTELVVLSACESARGRELPSEGALSLARGFLHAGAHHVVAASLAIPDVATSELMTRFYRALWLDHLPVGAALRRAQAGMAHGDWAAPYYWAGFAVTSVAID